MNYLAQEFDRSDSDEILISIASIRDMIDDHGIEKRERGGNNRFM